MAISKLSIFSFRNHEEKEIYFSKGITVIWGENGSGKTSLLEAIYILSIGKSFKTHKQRTIIKKGCSNYLIRGDFFSKGVNNKVGLQASLKGKKTIKINGKITTKRKDLIGKNNVVILSPEDQSVTKGGPKERRDFFDRLFSIINKDYLNTLQSFNRALKQRNALLVNKNTFKEQYYLPWEEKLSNYAIKLWELRKKCFYDFTNCLNNAIREFQKELTLSLFYDEKVYIGNDYINILKKSREKDLLMGRTSKGPHRDNIHILWGKDNIRECGSQGEHKIALVLLKLAEINLIKRKTGEYPIVLLDDVFAKLDLKRSKKLVSYFNSIKTNNKNPIQTIITTTDVLSVEKSGLTLKKPGIKTYKLDS